MSVRLGVERVLAGDFLGLRSGRIGLIHHQASVTSDLTSSVVALLKDGFDVQVLFGPQHGARGEKQDNMIESGDYIDPATGLRVHSLYGGVRKPTPAMLEGLDFVLFDLQDVGVRIYTFVWTMALAMEACAEAGLRFVVLDRPNPIGGILREGPVLRPGFESFVGLHPIPLRHGLTVGELAQWMNEERSIGCDLQVVHCHGWQRDMLWHDTGLPWVMPSPNLPTVDSCIVYPGMVLLEGTNLSEGRGTTRPFELFGAPYLNPQNLAEEVLPLLSPGVTIHPRYFEPAFQKHQGVICGGGQLHVSDVKTFRPVHTALVLLVAARSLAGEALQWRLPPYEYEDELMPIDMLWGHDGLRLGIDAGKSGEKILGETVQDLRAFDESITNYLIYE